VRFLADENVPGAVVSALRDRGYDVVSVRESLPGATDRAVLELAPKELRILITFDRDFGELAYNSMLPATSGIILIRLSRSTPAADNARVLAALDSRSDWPGHFSVISDDRIRVRPLPDKA
jgi:predicted nuclease of predicted toxin-antitoxin system